MQYFQYVKDEEYGIFICSEMAVKNFLTKHNFSEISEKNFLAQKDQLGKNCRVLSVNRATSRVCQYIHTIPEDGYKERVTQKKGSYLYRLQGYGLMVFTPFLHSWELGVTEDFGDVRCEIAHKIILNRFIGSALASWGGCGFWGTSMSGGAVMMKKELSLGEAVFLNTSRLKTYTTDGIKPLEVGFSFFRLCSNHGKGRKMAPEELLSLLSHHSTVVDGADLSGLVKKMIYQISLNYQGYLLPRTHYPLSPGKEVAV